MGLKQHCVENPSDDLFLQYKVHLSQPLPEDKIARIYAFARAYKRCWKAVRVGVLNITWLSGEAHFHFNGYIKKQNIRFWTIT
jgi:hypothetical protein